MAPSGFPTSTGPIRMAIIDGTGVWNDDDYKKDMTNSFCSQLYRLLGTQQSNYWRGPSNLGLESGSIELAARHWLYKQHKETPDARLMLAGYSRGGSIAMAVAETLAGSGTRVDSMFLFDAVSRKVAAGGRVITNVDFCVHAHRSQDPDFVAKYEPDHTVSSLLGPVPFLIDYVTSSNKTRPFFGNVGLTGPGDAFFRQRTFVGSHGAMGGVGWKSVKEDPACQISVAAWMSLWLQARRMPVSLTSFPPTSV